jgi:hypothetical protein
MERVEAATPCRAGDRTALAEHSDAFTERGVLSYWTLVGIVYGWERPPVTEQTAVAWERYAQALRGHP